MIFFSLLKPSIFCHMVLSIYLTCHYLLGVCHCSLTWFASLCVTSSCWVEGYDQAIRTISPATPASEATSLRWPRVVGASSLSKASVFFLFLPDKMLPPTWLGPAWYAELCWRWQWRLWWPTLLASLGLCCLYSNVLVPLWELVWQMLCWQAVLCHCCSCCMAGPLFTAGQWPQTSRSSSLPCLAVDLASLVS